MPVNLDHTSQSEKDAIQKLRERAQATACEVPAKSYPTAALKPISGLEGPKDLTVELWREYDFADYEGRTRTYRISDPVAFYYRIGGTTHRVVDRNGVVHCVPAPGQNGCVLRWKNRDTTDPVTY